MNHSCLIGLKAMPLHQQIERGKCRAARYRARRVGGSRLSTHQVVGDECATGARGLGWRAIPHVRDGRHATVSIDAESMAAISAGLPQRGDTAARSWRSR